VAAGCRPTAKRGELHSPSRFGRENGLQKRTLPLSLRHRAYQRPSFLRILPGSFLLLPSQPLSQKIFALAQHRGGRASQSSERPRRSRVRCIPSAAPALHLAPLPRAQASRSSAVIPSAKQRRSQSRSAPAPPYFLILEALSRQCSFSPFPPTR